MTFCEMCGKEGPLGPAMIEGSELIVCAACGKFGKALKKPFGTKKIAIQKAPEPIESVVDDYAQKIRTAREKSGMTQKDFALKLNEKESVVQKLESGSFMPPISLARKLERMLHISLVEVEKEEKVEMARKSAGPLTIGDLISLKKK